MLRQARSKRPPRTASSRPRELTPLPVRSIARFMNTQIPNDELALMKFGIGQPVPRVEDPKLLRGEGRYTDDLNLPGQVYAVMVRSPHAHGVIRNIETDTARAM